MKWHLNLALLLAACLLGSNPGRAATGPGIAGTSSAATPTRGPVLPRAYPVQIPDTGSGNAVISLQCAPGAITCLEVVSTGGQVQASLPVTWGQTFRAGDWQHATQTLTAQVDNTPIALQADEISSHRDGSARFAVLSAQLVNVPAAQKRIINLYATATTKPAAPATLPQNPDWNLEIEAQLYGPDQRPMGTLIALPQEQLKTQIVTHAKPRLQGPVATEYTVVTAFKDKTTGQTHPHLTARLHTRLYDAGQRIRTDVVLENTRTWTTQPGNITYALTIRRNGKVLHVQPSFTHYHHARWHTVVWTGDAAPALRTRHDMPYFMASRASWNYDLGLSVPEKTLAKQFAQLQDKRKEQEALGPMGNVFLTPAFGTTGARADIGPFPEWTVYYLLSQDERAKEVMLANADAAASVPIHYRDEETGQPVDVTRHPRVSVFFGTSRPSLPAVKDRTIWAPDTAHQGSFSYIPYVMTGDAFYLDETLFWAAWNVASVNAQYRNESAGLIRSNQVRAQAWALRSIGEAVRALPDTHPMKNYFDERLVNNLKTFINPADESPMGILHHHGDISRIHPWQNDYVSIILSLLAQNKAPYAFEALQWTSQFTVGRFLNEASGFCLARAPGGGWVYRDEKGKYIQTWKNLLDLNYPSDKNVPCSALSITEGYPHLGIGYAASARAMLAAASNAGITGAKSAYFQWKNMTPLMDDKLANSPTWAIVPR